MSLEKLVRPNIKLLKPYQSARESWRHDDGILLDANENALGSVLQNGMNRYPDPQQRELKHKLGSIRNIDQSRIFLGNGSDEAIDLLFRVFCEPGIDNVLIPQPTYGMYKVCAEINDVTVIHALLSADFQVQPEQILQMVNNQTKLIFLCSPNNPTGNCLQKSSIHSLLENFNGLIVLDEAYIDFSPDNSLLDELNNYPNLVILQTFSKAWGLAGIRLGVAYARAEIISLLEKIKYPYNINAYTQNSALQALDQVSRKDRFVAQLRAERKALVEELRQLPLIEKVYPSDANFLLVKCEDAKDIYRYLRKHRLIVRNRSSLPRLDNCLRITVGTPEENKTLIELLKGYGDR